MRFFFVFFILLHFLNLNSQRNIPDLAFVLKNNETEIDSKLSDIESAFELNSLQMDSLRSFVDRVMVAYPVNANMPRSFISFRVNRQESVEIDFNSTSQFNVVIDHLNLTSLLPSQQQFQGSSYTFYHPSFRNIELNIIAVTNFVQGIRPQGVYFIITDMDRL